MTEKSSQFVTIVIAILCVVAFAVPTPTYARAEPERVFVEFVPGRQAQVLNSLESQGAEVHYQFDELNVVVMTLPAEARQALSRSSDVVRVEPDVRRYLADQVVPYGVDAVEARDVWDADRDGVVDPGAPTGAGRMVCIIDSGIEASHEDFSGVNIVGGYPSGWDTDNYGHGTHVAGTVAAVNNDTGVLGVTPGEVSLYILKVYGDNGEWIYSSTLIDAAYRCRDAGADIISMSLSGPYYSSYENTHFQTLYDQGLLLVAAAGNSGGTAYGYPASYDAVISVAAVDQNNVVASFSQKNDKVELAAPGVSVYSTYKGGGYAYMSGTSMSTPHVSAAAAVVWSSDPNRSNAEIRGVLQQTALDLGAAGRDNEYGYGVVKTACAIAALHPTAVELARFEARSQSEGILVEWETASEVDNLGFNLYRSESPEGRRVQMNRNLIPSQAPGGPVGATYTWSDTRVSAGTTYYYWLEAVDVHGTATGHGPVSATAEGARRRPRSRP